MAESTHMTLCQAVADAIVALELPSYPDEVAIGADRVLVRWGIDIRPIKLPAVFILPVGTKAVVGGTNGSDDWAYPVSIYLVDRQSLEDPAPMDSVLLWRERIERRFIYQRLGPAMVCQFNSSPVLDDRLVQAYQLLAEPIFFAFIVREARG